MIRKLNLFYTTCGSITDAEDFAKKMISDNFASCINIINDVKSFYKENSKINSVNEIVLVIKTVKRFKEIEIYLNNNHPYSIPFIGELNINKINDKYLEWISKNL
jgi:periplasmic divalent cation tolerance protein